MRGLSGPVALRRWRWAAPRARGLRSSRGPAQLRAVCPVLCVMGRLALCNPQAGGVPWGLSPRKQKGGQMFSAPHVTLSRTACWGPRGCATPGPGVHTCFHRRRQKAGGQLARAAGCGEGAREALGAPASPRPEGPGPVQQRQQLRVRVPRGQSQQRRGAPAVRSGHEDTQPWHPGPRVASRGVARAPPGQSVPPREAGRPAAAETEEIF